MANCVSNEPNYSGGEYSTTSSGSKLGGYSSGTSETAYGYTVDFSGNWGYNASAVSSNPKANKYESEFKRAGENLGCDWRIIAALAKTESGINPDAQNPKTTAGGLFQFTDDTWIENAPEGMRHDMSKKNNVSASISALIKMWQITKKKFANCQTNDRVALMIQAHHHGVYGTTTSGGNKWENYTPKGGKENQQFLSKVIGNYRQLCK